MNLKETQLFYLVIKLTRDKKQRNVLLSYFFVVIITLMLSRVFSEVLMSISDKHNHKTFTKCPPASLLYCIESILSHSSGKCGNSLSSMAALSFTKSTGFCTKYIHQYQLSNSVIISSEKDDNDTSLGFSSHKSLWYSKRLRVLNN